MNKHFRTVLAVLMGATAWLAHAADFPAGYSKCANEGGTCTIKNAPNTVAYGIKDKWVYKYVTTSTVTCNTATFGSDPYPNVSKKCSYNTGTQIVTSTGATATPTATKTATATATATKVATATPTVTKTATATPTTTKVATATPTATKTATATPTPTKAATATPTATTIAVPSNYPNLFVSLLGKTSTEVDSKVSTAVNRFFGVGTNESSTPVVASGYRCYYELPQNSSMAFIWAPDSADIRSEGQSYGMMLAVQMNMQTQFDKLWNFAKAYMQYPSGTSYSAWKYYFKWRGTVDTSGTSSWPVTFSATTVPAPDGDEYFAAALYLADKRWGSSGTINYRQEADNITSAMLHNTATSDSRYPLIHTSQNMVVFVPYGNSYGFTDPSYHLPAFYELFALYGPSTDQSRWKSLATISRNFLVSSAHTTTGLHPDYANFAGAGVTASSGDGHDQFRYDAWRVVMNMAVDQAWWSADARMKTQVEKYHSFFTSYLGTNNVTQSLFALDGTSASGGGSTALTGTLAVGSLVSGNNMRSTYVGNLWNVSQQSGTYRYYQESVYLLALLNVSGKFRAAW